MDLPPLYLYGTLVVVFVVSHDRCMGRAARLMRAA
jgi:hypothetical protein